MAPVSASTSPRTALPETPTSTPVATAAPPTATAMPIHTIRGSRRPWARAISPCQTGWVATRAVDVATEVSWALGTQVAK